jgi:hypothetical protein
LTEITDRRLATAGRTAFDRGDKKFPKLNQRDINHILQKTWVLINDEPSLGCTRVLDAKAMGEATWMGDASDRTNRARIYIENRWSCKENMKKKHLAMNPETASDPVA